jgi:hypothetical protein
MLFNYVPTSGHAVPKFGIKIDNVVIEITGTPSANSWSAIQGATKSYSSDVVTAFDNVYVFGTTKIGRETSSATNGILNTWIGRGEGNVNAYADGVLTQEIGEKIAANGSIWKYENGKLTMKNQTESVDLINN